MAKGFFEKFKVGYRKGETIFKDGELGSEMFIIRSGKVKISRTIGGKEYIYAVLEKGDFFGEMAVLESLPREGSAVALEDVELISITSSSFEKMIKANIELAVRMLRKFSERLRRANTEIEQLLKKAGKDEKRPMEALSPVGPPKAAAKPPDSLTAMKPVLIVKGTSRKYAIKATEAIIGREDPVTGLKPTIDLTSEDINRFVSRRHARILFKDAQFHLVEEVGVTNGTYLNGKRLQAGTPAPLKFGDEVCFGRVYLMFDQDK